MQNLINITKFKFTSNFISIIVNLQGLLEKL